jgi:hypothetical protein
VRADDGAEDGHGAENMRGVLRLPGTALFEAGRPWSWGVLEDFATTFTASATSEDASWKDFS